MTLSWYTLSLPVSSPPLSSSLFSLVRDKSSSHLHHKQIWKRERNGKKVQKERKKRKRRGTPRWGTPSKMNPFLPLSSLFPLLLPLNDLLRSDYQVVEFRLNKWRLKVNETEIDDARPFERERERESYSFPFPLPPSFPHLSPYSLHSHYHSMDGWIDRETTSLSWIILFQWAIWRSTSNLSRNC